MYKLLIIATYYNYNGGSTTSQVIGFPTTTEADIAFSNITPLTSNTSVTIYKFKLY